MKKQELIHLHGLLAQVQDHYEKEISEEIDLENYEEVGVQPTSIHKSKTDHQEAVFALSKCITADMQSEEAEQTPVAAD
jgi:hypothetical protein